MGSMARWKIHLQRTITTLFRMTLPEVINRSRTSSAFTYTINPPHSCCAFPLLILCNFGKVKVDPLGVSVAQL